MKAALKKKLRAAAKLLDEGKALIADVEYEYIDTKAENDEYYALQDIEVVLGDLIENLRNEFKL